MPVILLRMTRTRKQMPKRPRECPHCKSQIIQRWGHVTKTVKGHNNSTAHVYRYRCQSCCKTFREYPKGLDRSYYTPEIRKLAALIWALGLSTRKVIKVFEERDIKLSRSTVWREGQKLVAQQNGEKLQQDIQPFRIDQNYIYSIGSNYWVVLAIDFGDGKYTILGTLDEHNPIRVTTWLKPLIKDVNLKVLQLGTGQLNVLHTKGKIESREHFSQGNYTPHSRPQING